MGEVCERPREVEVEVEVCVCMSAGFGGEFRCQYADTAPQYVEAVLEWWEEAHVRGLHDAIERSGRMGDTNTQ